MKATIKSLYSWSCAYRWPISIVGIGAILFVITNYFETPLVFNLWQEPWPLFCELMSRSIFEGGAFGASDIGVTLAILAFFKWIAERRFPTQSSVLKAHRFKFIWLSAVSSSIASIHSIKWIVSRARPKVFFSHEMFPKLTIDQLTSIHWPGFTTWDGPRGSSWNSLPSGHTATATILLISCYLYWPVNRKCSISLWVLVTLFAVAMAVARSMAGMHWLSDSVASYFLVWSIIHLLSAKMNIHNRIST